MKEEISALMDGQFDDRSLDSSLKQIKSDPELRESWNLYHLIGDAMRGHSAGALPRSFVDRLEAEPIVFAPRKPSRTPVRWAMSAAAGVAAVGFVGWMSYPFLGADTARVAVTQPSSQQTEVVVMPVAKDMDDYQLAHQRFSPGFGMSGVAPYVRTVSSDDGQR
ncbi:MAG TPA: sigma-E factor negative regulatory protein [Burkholderiales bacterium]|jgi:sigma-E factor negative regulatory protein RseA|nr:sigma-E factor negative regulatory protein [Burkholderiales bacterium]